MLITTVKYQSYLIWEIFLSEETYQKSLRIMIDFLAAMIAKNLQNNMNCTLSGGIHDLKSFKLTINMITNPVSLYSAGQLLHMEKIIESGELGPSRFIHFPIGSKPLRGLEL